VLGFPIRTPSDHSSFDNSPRTIAAYHVLHRPLVPRHPPNALKHLQQHLTPQGLRPRAPPQNRDTRNNTTPTTLAICLTNIFFQLEQNTQTKNIDSICIAKIKMLASTMHFSNNTHPQHHRISAPHHRTPHQHDNHCKHQDNTTSVFPQNPDSVLAAPHQSPSTITRNQPHIRSATWRV
jgi:hypothetical protein